MPRYTYPSPDFQCLHEHNCPYLNGLSTKWVWDEYERADSQYHEHLRIIDAYKEHIQEDIVLKPSTVVTRYLHKQAYCAHCSRPVIKAADNELLNAHIGPVAKSTAI